MEALEERTRTLEAARRGARGAAPRRAPAVPGRRSERAARREAASAPSAPLAGAARPGAPEPSSGASPEPGRLEDLLGGRVLAWVGGLAVLVGIVFLLAIAVSRGWIGEEARTIMAGLTSLGLLGFGVRLFEHRGRTEAALAATAAGIAGLFATTSSPARSTS